MGKGGGTTTTRNEIPAELSQLFQTGAGRIQELAGASPLTQFNTPMGRPMQTSKGAVIGQGGPEGVFGTADRAPQFADALQQIGQSGQIANQPLASRGVLDARPAGTSNASAIAQNAQLQAENVPSGFSNLNSIAGQQVGLQGLENSAIDRAGALSSAVGQTPAGFSNTLNQFQAGVDPLQQLAGTVPGQFGDVRAQANPGIADLISRSDQQITGEGIQQSPAFQAALDAFESTLMPTIQNSAQQAGLGRSTGLQQSLAAGQAQFMLPVIQEELARQERGLERGLGARQFGITTDAELGLQEALAQERGVGRATDIGQFGLATAADLGLQEALGAERGLQRFGQAEQFAAGLEADTGRQLAARQEAQIGRQLDATLQSALAGERGIERGQNAAQFRAGIEQAAGSQDLARALEGLGADERSRALQFEQSQSSIPQRIQLGQLEQDFRQSIEDRRTQDFLRRQALAEQALFQPFGMIAPSAISQRASTSGKKGK